MNYVTNVTLKQNKTWMKEELKRCPQCPNSFLQRYLGSTKVATPSRPGAPVKGKMSAQQLFIIHDRAVYTEYMNVTTPWKEKFEYG